MNKLFAIAAVAAFAAISTPSFAQSYDPSVGSGNIVSGLKGGLESGRSARPLYDYAPMARSHHHVDRDRMRAR